MEIDSELVRLAREVVSAEAALDGALAKDPDKRGWIDQLARTLERKRLDLTKYTESHPHAVIF